MGPQGLLVVRLPAPFVPHSASLGPAKATRVLSAPVPVSAPPTGLDGCLFFIFLVLDFLAIRFSVSSVCARRRSVSTYTAILVLDLEFLMSEKRHRYIFSVAQKKARIITEECKYERVRWGLRDHLSFTEASLYR